MTLLTELDAFFTDYRQCGDLDAGVEWPDRLDRVRLRGQHGQASGRGRRCRRSLNWTPAAVASPIARCA
jgi:hypothetical protein